MGEDRPRRPIAGPSRLTGTPRPYQFYGRRIGHALRPQQARLMVELLPRLRVAIDDPRLATPALLFDPPVAAVELEIGFGGGEHLAARAAGSTGTGFIGAEPFVNGIAKLLSAVAAARFANVRIFDDDVRHLLPAIGDGTLVAVHLLFPDPWPKKRHQRRRFVQPATIAEIHRLLAPGGRFVFVSDAGDYAVATLQQVLAQGGFAWTAERPSDWRWPRPDSPSTRYEAKALSRGAKAIHLEFEKKARQ
jgi:tRNA (guanine-N7-)-methyltransferase